VTAVPLAFVLKLAAELAPAAAGDGASQLTVADHVVNREVFDHDEISFADQAGAGAVQEVPSRVADLAVRAGDFGSGLGPVGRPLPAAGQAPLVALQAAGFALQVTGIGGPLPGAGDGEVRHAEVDADNAAGLLQGLGGIGVDGEGYIRPASVSRPHPRSIAHVIEKPLEPRRAGDHLCLPRCAGHRRPRPEGRGIFREVW
jgi:hypothetical protein